MRLRSAIHATIPASSKIRSPIGSRSPRRLAFRWRQTRPTQPCSSLPRVVFFWTSAQLETECAQDGQWKCSHSLPNGARRRLGDERFRSTTDGTKITRPLVLLLLLLRGIGLWLVVFFAVFGFLSVFRFFRFLLAAFVFCRRRRRRPRRCRALLRVVGHIPSGAFELHGRSRDHLLDHASAFRALSQLLVREFPDLFKAMAAVLAQVFVVGHV